MIATAGLVILLKLASNCRFFSPYDLEIWWMTSKTMGTSFMLHPALCTIPKPSVNSYWNYSPETLNWDQNWYFVLFDLEICLCYLKLCLSFHSHLWVQIGVTVRSCPNEVKIGYVLSCVTSKFDGWPWKTIGHISYATSSLVHHFITICEFKPELRSRNS